MNQSTINQTVTYAPTLKRFIAYLLDIFIVMILTLLLFYIIKMFAFFTGGLSPSEFVERNVFYFCLCIFTICSWIYFTGMPTTSFSSTLGQLFMGLKQVDKMGNTITFKVSNEKFFSSIFSKIFYIGYLFVYFNAYHQTFHEMLTNSFLIER